MLTLNHNKVIQFKMKSLLFNTNSFSEIGIKNRSDFMKKSTLTVSAGIIIVLAAILCNSSAIYAEETADTTFEVNVKEALTVSITAPSEGATGDVGDFLRNTVSLSVTSNNANGFRASMYSQDSTNLTNTSKSTETLPTLDSGTSYTCTSEACTAFPANHWGYSLNDSSNTGTYYPMVSTSANPITLISASAGTTTGSQDVYFGAKADVTQAAGTYAGTVVISVVTGIIDSSTNPVTPTHPATPNSTPQVATYNSSPIGGSTNGTTTYTYTRSHTPSGAPATTTTTTEVSDGDNVNAYNGYVPPQGVRETINTDEYIAGSSSPLAAGLAATATAAAATGIIFFILAKRRDKDDEEQDQ